MESLSKDEILEFNENTLFEVRKLFNLHEPGAMKQAVKILEEWLTKQQNFTQKQFVLMRSCPNLQRTMKGYIYFFKNVGQKFEPTVMLSYARALNYMGEYAGRRDYGASLILVIDYREVNLTELATKLTISSMQEFVAMALECCGFRISGVYILSTSKLIDIVVTIFKQVLSSKIGSRIHVIKEVEELHKYVEKDILLEEYGGKETPLQTLHEKWINVLTSEEHMEYMKYMNSARTNENLRPKDQFNEQYMGMPGSFRTLNVD